LKEEPGHLFVWFKQLRLSEVDNSPGTVHCLHRNINQIRMIAYDDPSAFERDVFHPGYFNFEEAVHESANHLPGWLQGNRKYPQGLIGIFHIMKDRFIPAGKDQPKFPDFAFREACPE
jgi:hypothetical protein